MKRIVAAAVLVMSIAAGAFAVDFKPSPLKLSAGGGLLFPEQDWGGGADLGLTAFGFERSGLGAYGFFDATYAEVTVSYLFAKGTGSLGEFADAKTSVGILGLSVFGKYPIRFGENEEGLQLTLFPLVGVEYQLFLHGDDDGKAMDNVGDMNALWIRFGVGFDVTPPKVPIFIRAEALAGIRLASKFDEALVDALPGSSYNLGFGYQVKIGVGYRF